MSGHRRIEHLERISSMVHANWWSLVTTAPWHQIVEPGWLDRFWEHGLRKHDRIEVVASFQNDEPELGALLVTDNKKRQVTVKLLARHTPTEIKP